MSAPAIVSPFSWLDGSIAVFSLLATLWIGVRVKRYVGTLEDYLVASRGMGLYVGAASLLSTEVGIITFMYQAQFGFVAGFSAFAVGLITLAVCLLVGRTGFVVTRLREMEILTVPEYFEKRYGRSVRVLAGVLLAVGGSLNLGLFPIIEARFLAVVTGIPGQYLGWTNGRAPPHRSRLHRGRGHGLADRHELRPVRLPGRGHGGRHPRLPARGGLGHHGGRGRGPHGRTGLRSRGGSRDGLHPVAGPPLDRAHDGLAVGAVAIMYDGKVVDLDREIALTAADLSFELKLPIVDSIILATARAHGATLWTQDDHFKDIEGVKYIEKKPKK